MDPRTPFEPEPEPLSAEAQAILQAYRQDHEIPELVKARVRRRLRASAERRRRGDAWVLAAVVAAGVILVLAAIGVLPRPADRGVRGPIREAAEAAYVAASPEGRGAAIPGRLGRVSAGERPADGGEVGHGDAEAAVAAAAAAESGEGAATAGDRSPEIAGTGGAASGRAKTRTAAAAETIDPDDAPELDAPPAADARDPGPGASGASGAPAADASDLAAEKRLLEAAWRALAAGDDDGALAAIERHRREHPQGLLTQERAALEVITHCRARPRDPSARARVDAFAAAHPRSPWLGRIDAACASASGR